MNIFEDFNTNKIRHDGLFGITGSGKTWYGKEAFRLAPAMAIFLNTDEDSELDEFSPITVTKDNVLKILRKKWKKKEHKLVLNLKEGEEREILLEIKRLLWATAKANNFREEDKWMYLFVDEWDLYSQKQDSSPQIRGLATRSRKRGITLVVMSQRPALVEHTVLSQLRIKTYFRLDTFESRYYKTFYHKDDVQRILIWNDKEFHYTEDVGTILVMEDGIQTQRANLKFFTPLVV